MPSPSGATPKYGFAFPFELDIPDIPTWGLDLTTLLDEIVATDYQGIFSNRPTAGKPGRWYNATDVGVLYRDNGTSWDVIAGTAQVAVFTSSGTWTVPARVSSFTLIAVGAGGGGSGGYGSAAYSGGAFAPLYGGGGGGGGCAAMGTFSESPGTVLTITIGTGGSGSAGATSVGSALTPGGNGGATSITIPGPTTLLSGAGGGGAPDSSGFAGSPGFGIGQPGGAGGIAGNNEPYSGGVPVNGTPGASGGHSPGNLAIPGIYNTPASGGAGGNASTETGGGAGGVQTCSLAGGPGGGGGGSGNTAGTPGAGANASASTGYGSGGPGGGGAGSSTTAGANGGSGGAGGPGYVEIHWVSQ